MKGAGVVHSNRSMEVKPPTDAAESENRTPTATRPSRLRAPPQSIDVVRLLVEREVRRDFGVPHRVLRGLLEAHEHLANLEELLVFHLREVVEDIALRSPISGTVLGRIAVS